MGKKVTAKEKASELVSMFLNESERFRDDGTNEEAIHYALITVEEVRRVLTEDLGVLPFIFWDKVKEEIKKL